ncbi:hypothetical protein AcV5_006791 [Taiwanofungus camphoratus]|nr:hypothetical protein AcV5_006791 [Antrodia cinnamomea]
MDTPASAAIAPLGRSAMLSMPSFCSAGHADVDTHPSASRRNETAFILPRIPPPKGHYNHDGGLRPPPRSDDARQRSARRFGPERRYTCALSHLSFPVLAAIDK